MRGDASLTARLFLRGAGLGGSAVAVGGALLVVAVFLPWSMTVAEVEMLDHVDTRAVGSVPGVPAMWPGWLVLAGGVVAMGAGPMLALDRGPAATRAIVAGTAAVVACAAGIQLVFGPPASSVQESGDLIDVAERLPVGVSLELDAVVGNGPWVAVAGALVILLGCARAYDR